MPTASLKDALSHRMNYLIARQGVVAGNIANADTPGYLAKDLEFKTLLEAQNGSLNMKVTNSAHMGSQNDPSMVGKLNESTRFIQHNGNSVRLDNEMLKMQEAQLGYRLATQLYAKQAAMQKIAMGRAQ